MDIYAKPGTKVKFVKNNVCEESIKWGSHDSPYELEDGREYEILRTEVHSYHTKVHLKETPNKSFNSVWFD